MHHHSQRHQCQPITISFDRLLSLVRITILFYLLFIISVSFNTFFAVLILIVTLLIVLLMAESTSNSHKKDEGNHDGCTDCIRQKKENEAFIKIYERLQEVEKKTCRMRQAVSDHRSSSDNNRSFYQSYEQKVLNLPKMKGKDIPLQSMKSAGYEIAAALLEKEVKSNLAAENQRLKDILLKMQKEKRSQASHLDLKIREKQISPPSNQHLSRMQQSLNQTFISDLNSCESLYSHKQESQKLTNSQDTSDSCRENSSTQSSSFNLSKVRNSMDLSKYNDLNLWLYQNQKNAKLEEELYIAKQIKPRSFISKKTGSKLPSIKK